jgi:hypothetical protein
VMPRYDASRPVEEIALSSDQVEQAILEYIRDRNFLVGGAESVTLNWIHDDSAKAPRLQVVIKRAVKNETAKP